MKDCFLQVAAVGVAALNGDISGVWKHLEVPDIAVQVQYSMDTPGVGRHMAF